MKGTLHPVATGIAFITGIASGVFSLWCTLIAFLGGTFPLLGWEIEGSVGHGLLWLIIIDPILVGVSCWLSMIVVTPIALFIAARDEHLKTKTMSTELDSDDELKDSSHSCKQPNLLCVTHDPEFEVGLSIELNDGSRAILVARDFDGAEWLARKI